jgi:hypothetical protein
MSKKLTYQYEYTNRYNPNTRISFVTRENIRNHNLTIFDMFNIYNDIRYKANKNNGIIDENDIRPLLYVMLGIFRNNFSSTMLKINKELKESKNPKDKTQLINLLEDINFIDICIRQLAVNCGFGDLDNNNQVIKCFSESEIDSIFERVLTPSEIRYMQLFNVIKRDYDEYIDKLRNAVKINSKFADLFGTELCINNFIDGSIYKYLESVSLNIV